MEKQTIEIRKIKDGLFLERKDEVAIEQDFEIKLQNGEVIYGSCTPSYMEEMVLGNRYLAGDLTEEEKNCYEVDLVKNSLLEPVEVGEIFQVAEECFENPGSLFADTGCAHSCALICKGKVLCQMEDIGRYNALDKVIGYALMHKILFGEAYVFDRKNYEPSFLPSISWVTNSGQSQGHVVRLHKQPSGEVHIARN